MIKLSNVKWIAAAIVTGMLTLTASCGKDDTSLNDMQVEIWEKNNDLSNFRSLNSYSIDVLYGSVSTFTINRYNATWENNAVKEGDINDQEIFEFSKNGYITKRTGKYSTTIDGKPQLITSSETIFQSDSKNRKTLVEYIGYSHDGKGNITSSYISKTTTTYDDGAKTGSVITTYSNDGGKTYSDQSKRVYQLNQYGRIDEGNYVAYPTKLGFDTDPSGEAVTAYDNRGNKTLYYQKYIAGGIISIGMYLKAEYVYY